jgi:hypothetical protein
MGAITMDRAQYMREICNFPERFPESPNCAHPPAEWAVAAWNLEAVYDAIGGTMARNVSKIGALAWVTPSLLKMAAVLQTEQVVRLYERIRDRSPHRESEFRAEFEQSFSQHAAFLPPPLTRHQIIEKLQIDEETARRLLGEDE